MPRDLLSRYEQAREAGNLATALGRSGLAGREQSLAERIAANAERRGVDLSGLDIQEFGDWQSLNPADTNLARRGLLNLQKPRFHQGKNFDRSVNRFQIGLNTDIGAKAKEGFTRTVMPSLDAAQKQADEFVQQPAVGAGAEQALRSRISAMIRSVEGERLNRLSGTLGLGSSRNSPASAALASSISGEADQMLVNTLRDTALKTSEINREQGRRDVDLASRIATIRANVVNADPNSLIALNKQLASELDALYTRDQTLDLMWKQYEDATDESLGERISSYANSARNIGAVIAAPFTGGASLGMLGGGQPLQKPLWGGNTYGGPVDRQVAPGYYQSGGDPFGSSYRSVYPGMTMG